MSEATRPPQAYSGDDTPLVDLIDYDSVADEDLSRIVAIDVECVASGTGPRCVAPPDPASPPLILAVRAGIGCQDASLRWDGTAKQCSTRTSDQRRLCAVASRRSRVRAVPRAAPSPLCL